MHSLHTRVWFGKQRPKIASRVPRRAVSASQCTCYCCYLDQVCVFSGPIGGLKWPPPTTWQQQQTTYSTRLEEGWDLRTMEPQPIGTKLRNSDLLHFEVTKEAYWWARDQFFEGPKFWFEDVKPLLHRDENWKFALTAVRSDLKSLSVCPEINFSKGQKSRLHLVTKSAYVVHFGCFKDWIACHHLEFMGRVLPGLDFEQNGSSGDL